MCWKTRCHSSTVSIVQSCSRIKAHNGEGQICTQHLSYFIAVHQWVCMVRMGSYEMFVLCWSSFWNLEVLTLHVQVTLKLQTVFGILCLTIAQCWRAVRMFETGITPRLFPTMHFQSHQLVFVCRTETAHCAASPSQHNNAAYNIGLFPRRAEHWTVLSWVLTYLNPIEQVLDDLGQQVLQGKIYLLMYKQSSSTGRVEQSPPRQH